MLATRPCRHIAHPHQCSMPSPLATMPTAATCLIRMCVPPPMHLYSAVIFQQAHGEGHLNADGLLVTKLPGCPCQSDYQVKIYPTTQECMLSIINLLQTAPASSLFGASRLTARPGEPGPGAAGS